jgi:polyhydroxybutyrate depolymerase
MRRSLVVTVALLNGLGCLFAVTGCLVRQQVTGRAPEPTSVTSTERAAGASAPSGRSGDWSLPAGTTTRTLVSGGLTRSYRLHVSPDVGPHPPLVIALHGSLGTGQGMARLTGYDGVADEHAAVVAYPDGVDRSWSDGREASPADLRHVDDVGYLSALIGELVQDGADPRRVYVTGMSNGAFMAQRFACARADLVAAVAPVAGTYGKGEDCVPSRSVPVLDVHGTADPFVPYDGGPMLDRAGTVTRIESAQQAAQRWSRLDGCTASARRPGPDPTVVVTRWSPCRSGAAVELWTVGGAGHTWPGGLQYLPPAIIGSTSAAFSASRVTWAFFAAHPRTSP